jgi:hypothetical protein
VSSPPSSKSPIEFAEITLFRRNHVRAILISPEAQRSNKPRPLRNIEVNMIKKVAGGYKVLSEKGKNLGGPYKSKAAAQKRLKQVEFFKHKG